MVEFQHEAPAVGQERARCALCGAYATGLSLAPDICDGCVNGPTSGAPWLPSEVAYEVRMSAARAEQLSGVPIALDPFTVGPLRSKATAEELARVWGAEVVEVTPETHRVGADLVTTTGD